MIIDIIVWKHIRFQNVFHPHEKEKLLLSNSFSLKSVFEKAPFSWRSSVDGWPNRGNKPAFSRCGFCFKSEPTRNETLKWLWNCTVEWQSCNGFLFLSYFLDYLLIIVDRCSPRTENKYHRLVRIHINVYAWFLSTEDFADEFRRKGIVFNRALEDLEDRAKKCESLKNLVS